MARVSIVRWNLKEAGWQTSGLTNRNHIRLGMRVRLQYKSKPCHGSHNFVEKLVAVDGVDVLVRPCQVPETAGQGTECGIFDDNIFRQKICQRQVAEIAVVGDAVHGGLWGHVVVLLSRKLNHLLINDISIDELFLVMKIISQTLKRRKGVNQMDTPTPQNGERGVTKRDTPTSQNAE